MDCPFCSPNPWEVFYAGPRVLGLWNAYPVTPGHALLVPRRHVGDWFEADGDEQRELTEAIGIARQAILDKHKPDGFNVGMNCGAAAGQSVFHLHMHVIPRYQGQLPKVEDESVRQLIPTLWEKHLSTGEEADPFCRMLVPLLERARCVDIAVAFVQPSGLKLLLPHFQQMLQREGRLRLVTGDSLGVTDPDALTQLLDLADSYPARADIRVFESGRQSYHPKAYRIQDLDGSETAFVGSSNLTGSALQEGVEWNYRLVPVQDRDGQREIRAAFEALLDHIKTKRLTIDWIERYRQRRQPPILLGGASIAAEVTELEERPVFTPHLVQQEALQALTATRVEGNRAGLVVLATGLGKTYLAAFDSAPFARVLFVAHRDEILNQARDTFRRIRPEARLGLYTGAEKGGQAPILFASVQTLSRSNHLRNFARDAFDYVIIDEFHHAAASTYRRLIEYFQPRYLLGLTATPERTDGGDLLGLCMENLVYRCDLIEGVRRDLLVPFHYYGVPDTVDYRQVRWRSGRFDPQDLDAALLVESRAQHALEQYHRHAGQRTLAFCSSQRHSDYMDAFFRSQGLRSASIHSGASSAPRTASLDMLRDGQLDILCSVDMFNEGLDLPAVDTVMMLRPTESEILWLQQFGRGLRKAQGKTHLTVIDYIGNHRIFFSRPEMLLSMAGAGSLSLLRSLDQLKSHADLELPPGCLIEFDLEAIQLLESLLRKEPKDVFLAWYQGFKQIHERRPSASEALHQGYNPRSVRKRNGSWLGFVSAQGDMDAAAAAAYRDGREFLAEIETSHGIDNLILLQAMINLESLPGSLPMGVLATEFANVASRSARLQADLSVRWDDSRAVQHFVREFDLGGFFRLEGDRFTCSVGPSSPELVSLIGELVAWRLADYLAARAEGLVCKVSQAGGRPILFLPTRGVPDVMPMGPTPVLIDGVTYTAQFAKIAINVVHPSVGKADNVLARILRGWFGPDAGQPGTAHRVVLEKTGAEWELKAMGRTGVSGHTPSPPRSQERRRPRSHETGQR